MEKSKVVEQFNIFYNMQPDIELLNHMRSISETMGIACEAWARPRIMRYCRS